MLNLDQCRYYNNREVTWIDYDKRVLDEASNPVNPLLERARLLGITQNNLDSFIKVRAAKIIKRMHEWPNWRDASGLTFHDQLNAIRTHAHRLVKTQYHIWEKHMLPALAKHGIYLRHVKDLSPRQRRYADEYFQKQLYPVITPIAVDGTHPFPFIESGKTCMAILIRRPKDDKEYFAMIPIAFSFPRVIRLPFNHGNDFILQEDLIKNYLGQIFQGLNVRGSVCFRLTRDQDIAIDDRETKDLVYDVDNRLRKMRYGRPLRVEIEANANPKIMKFIQDHYKLADCDMYKVDGPVDLHFINEMVKKIRGHKNLMAKKYTPFFPDFLRKISIFKAIRKHDLFFHRPFDSFKPILVFLREAADDPKVISVKITLYRVSKHSPVIAALKRAAKNGKLVTVLIELKARGDEAANTKWALQLQQLGCHVIYGMKGLKVHCKLAMVVRREKGGVRRYMHMSTSNYNEKTAKHYVDMDLFTCNPEIG